MMEGHIEYKGKRGELRKIEADIVDGLLRIKVEGGWGADPLIIALPPEQALSLSYRMKEISARQMAAANPAPYPHDFDPLGR